MSNLPLARYDNGDVVVITAAPRHPIEALSDEELADYEASPTGDSAKQVSALLDAAHRAADPAHVSDITPAVTARQRLGLDP